MRSDDSSENVSSDGVLDHYWNDENPYAVDPRLLERNRDNGTLTFHYRPSFYFFIGFPYMLLALWGVMILTALLCMPLIYYMDGGWNRPPAEIAKDLGTFMVVWSLSLSLVIYFVMRRPLRIDVRMMATPMEVNSYQPSWWEFSTWFSRHWICVIYGDKRRKRYFPCRNAKERDSVVATIETYRQKFW